MSQAVPLDPPRRLVDVEIDGAVVGESVERGYDALEVLVFRGALGARRRLDRLVVQAPKIVHQELEEQRHPLVAMKHQPE